MQLNVKRLISSAIKGTFVTRLERSSYDHGRTANALLSFALWHSRADRRVALSHGAAKGDLTIEVI